MPSFVDLGALRAELAATTKHVERATGRTYRIKRGRVANIDVLNELGAVVQRLCAHPALNVPDSDTMLAQEIIRTQRDGLPLSTAHIQHFVRGLVDGSWSEGQAAALAMAILLNGMNRREISRWTGAMIASGERMDFSRLSRPTADKHSTGGVGDVVSLMLGPMVAACGGFVPMISGRGLGHTGGTLDKFDAIPGYNTTPDPDTVRRFNDTKMTAVVSTQAQTAAMLKAFDAALAGLVVTFGTKGVVTLMCDGVASRLGTPAFLAAAAIVRASLVVIASEFSRDAMIEGRPGSKAKDQAFNKSGIMTSPDHYGLHRHFTEPELVELGCFIALTMGQQSWLRLLNIDHHQILVGTAASMAPPNTPEAATLNAAWLQPKSRPASLRQDCTNGWMPASTVALIAAEPVSVRFSTLSEAV